MVNRKYGSHMGISKPPRQTIWCRKKKQKRIESLACILTPEDVDQPLIEDIDLCDQLSDTGNVLQDDGWDVSSISSIDELPEHVSDDSSFLDLSDDCNEGFEEVLSISTEIPLASGLQITRRESLNLVSAFCKKANLTRDCTDELLKLIKLHLPSSINYPGTSYKLQSCLRIQPIQSKNCYYCESCDTILSNFICEKCNKTFQVNQVVSAGNYFVVYDISIQMNILLNNVNVNKNLTNELQQRSKMAEKEKEGLYGVKYCEIVQGWNISLTTNTDGVPVFKSSKYSIWPVLFAVNELPYKVGKSAILLGALWFGSKKINVDLVFSNLVPQLNLLQENGILWTNSVGEVVSSKIFFQKVSVDSVARCIVQGISQFNGACGCNYCKDEGVVVPKGRGRCRVYTSTNDLNIRTDANHRELVLAGRHEFGVKCATPFLNLKHFDIIAGFPVEPMHNVFLGVTKMIFNLWFTLKRSDCYLGSAETRQTINKRLLSCKVTTEIVRTIRPLESIKHWKASEFRTLLFVMSLVTADLLPKAYHKHFCKLANSIFYLSQPILQSENIAFCKRNLHQFVKNVSNLYGEEYMSYNVHLLLHLVQSCIDFGPLWQFSAFMFESFNAILLKYISSANGVSLQISKKFSSDFQTRFDLQSIFKNKDASLMFSHLARAPKCLPVMYHVRKPFSDVYLDEAALTQCRELANVRRVLKARKAVINGYLFKAWETEKRADNYVRVDEIHIGRVREFLKIECSCQTPCDCKKELAVLEIFRVAKLPFVDFGFKCNTNVRKRVRVIPISQLTNNKFIKLEYDSHLYFLHICNLFEID